MDDGKTLGAWRRSKAVSTIPTVETFYWLPCASVVPGVEWPHAFFITSNLQGSIRCPGCRGMKHDPRDAYKNDGQDLAFSVL